MSAGRDYTKHGQLVAHIPQSLQARLGFNDWRAKEEEWRALPDDQQPYLVVVFTALDYTVMSEFATERRAEREAEWLRGQLRKIQRAGLKAISPFSGAWADGGDIMVRQQWDLDALTRAIRDSYNY